MPGGGSEDKNIFDAERVLDTERVLDAERVLDHNSEDSTEIPNMFLPGIHGIPIQVNTYSKSRTPYIVF